MSTTPEPAGYEPDFDAIRANLRQFTKDTDYFQTHWEEWREKYPDHYVLVHDEKLISTSTNLKETIRLAESQGVRPGHAAMEFFSTDTDDLILGSWLKSVCNRRENSPSNVAIPPTTCLAAPHTPRQTGPVLLRDIAL